MVFSVYDGSKDLYTMVLSVRNQNVPLAVHGDAFKTLRFNVKHLHK